MEVEKKWFSEWFNTKYYHILYQNRDDNEAQLFIHNLFKFLDLKKESCILDAACGSGRHSVMVNHLGFKVHGMDLSPESINTAKTNESETLSFSVADLRKFKQPMSYDVILNLFTSFGYFDSKSDNLQVLSNFKESLRPNGTLVLDFMNAYKVKQNLVHKESKTLNQIDFNITRKVENNIIIKQIQFKDHEGLERNYQERVSGFEKEDFQRLFQEVGFEICHIFGDYFLNEFDRIESPRLILVAKPS